MSILKYDVILDLFLNELIPDTKKSVSKGNKISSRSFDMSGNFSFSIKEHIDISGVKYDPKIGIHGLDIAVKLTRPGFSISVRSRHKSTIGKNHKITSEEAKKFVAKEFGISVS